MKRVALLGTAVFIAVGMFGCAKKETKTAKKSPGLQRVHFDFDKSDIKKEHEPVLRNNAAWIQAHNNKKIVIEGHCDERGSLEYNIALGDRRATTAKTYLSNLGVASNHMSTISYGEERPLATCHDESCWWQNRRAEFVAK